MLLGSPSRETGEVCCWVSRGSRRCFGGLREFFERDSVGLDEEQKKIFTEFLCEFQDIFTEQVVPAIVMFCSMRSIFKIFARLSRSREGCRRKWRRCFGR